MTKRRKYDVVWAILAVLGVCVLMACLTGCIEEQQAPKLWGQGDPPADWQEFFGNDNNSRLNYMQSQYIDRLTQQIWELRADMPADPNR